MSETDDQKGYRVMARAAASILFGLLLPALITWSASQELKTARAGIEGTRGGSYIMDTFEKSYDKLQSGNDYALVALADSERANLAVMINKQVMKLVVIYMGFAVMSFAIMFIVLGFTDGPVSVAGEGAGYKLDLKFGTIGAAVFVLGAVMAAGGGLLPNDYKTVGLPGFIAMSIRNDVMVDQSLQKSKQECRGFKDDEQLNCIMSHLHELRESQEAAQKGERE